MDKVTQYQQWIEQLLIQYSKDDPIAEGVETQLVFDPQRHHYYWMNVGWEGNNRIFSKLKLSGLFSLSASPRPRVPVSVQTSKLDT